MRTMRRYLIFLIVPAVFILDRWTKWLVTENLGHMEDIHITSFFSLVNWRNLGGAFGFLAGHHLGKIVFTAFPLIIALVLVYLLVAHRFSTLKTFSLACILAGAVGNIYDRMCYGYVVDFLLFYYRNLQWPAFNVADISVSTGVGLWLFAELRASRKPSPP